MSLAEYMETSLEPAGGESTRFRVDGPATADWALRKLARIRARQAENSALAAVERERIGEWERDENAKLQHDADFFAGLLSEWHRLVLDAEPDRRTVALPAGKLVARKQPDRWDFDAAAFLQWAVRAGRAEFVRTPAPEVDKAAAKKALAVKDGAVVDTATGEVVEGVTVEPGDVRYSVEVTP